MIRKESQTPVTGLQKIIEDTRRIDYKKLQTFSISLMMVHIKKFY